MIVIAIDEGNTLVKTGVFQDGVLKETLVHNELRGVVPHLIGLDDAKIIYSSVRGNSTNPEDLYALKYNLFILNTETPLPFSHSYQSISTLGNDRKAATAGVSNLYPGLPAVAINLGTCITFDVINAEGHYLGGTISPGLRMRYRSMNEFTAALPLLEPFSIDKPYIGDDTQSCMHHGVIGGIVSEIEHRISGIESKYPGLKVVMSGGDAPFIAPYISTFINLHPHLNLLGLYSILKHLLELR